MATSGETGSQNGRGFKETLKRDGMERLQSGKMHAAERIEDIADAIDSAGIQLDRSQPTLAGYASRVADQIGVIAGRLREGSVEDLAYDARQLATRNPAMFLLGSAAVGLFVARFLRVSGEPETEDEPIDESPPVPNDERVDIRTEM